jgi:hypothetical protein
MSEDTTYLALLNSVDQRPRVAGLKGRRWVSVRMRKRLAKSPSLVRQQVAWHRRFRLRQAGAECRSGRTDQ